MIIISPKNRVNISVNIGQSGILLSIKTEVSMPALWEQQIAESSRAFSAFARYRDLGPSRSLDRAYRCHIGKEQATAPGTWRKWCTQFAWYRRATAYDG